MTSTDQHLIFRPPVWARVWVVVFPLVFVFVGLSGLVPLRGNPGWALRIVVCLFAVALCWRLFRLAAIGTPDGRLIVRNHWRDRTLHRDDIERVVIDRAGRGWSVQVELADGSAIPLDVTEVPVRPPFERQLERKAAAVSDWVDGRPQPFL